MKKHYFLILFFVLAFFTAFSGFSQNNANTSSIQQNIEDLSIYPNPVSNGKTFIYITSKLNLTKKIEFYDVLGKRIFSSVLTGKELNISNLSKGVYVLKITENNISETRKLVIK
ncbi:putative secreted protein (Por secretion system target) [Mariniflexile fucanivorans]|uniref:Putative secreted protein (Por secretion system target) n=1 Tax=Mariniflexile fucanivorans TaxID=264023 RepID=A0A4V2QEN9_9FLAO|nr:T9SS type A sorting domain-containing protein [Mariniflexile fucanivorans]TCL68787.1 putative secreted protein (Por secretion system target) [Mariniflexile fucanivorans]